LGGLVLEVDGAARAGGLGVELRQASLEEIARVGEPILDGRATSRGLPGELLVELLEVVFAEWPPCVGGLSFERRGFLREVVVGIWTHRWKQSGELLGAGHEVAQRELVRRHRS
jgi:hypothetical protein